jgi:GxxExxY protein
MNANERESLESLVKDVIGAAYEVGNSLGGGFLEKVYERAMLKELALRGWSVRQQVAHPITYKGAIVGEYFADLLVEDTIVIELKCAEHFAPEHVAQCINYLKASGLNLALLFNFKRSKVEWKRIVNNL